MDDQSLLWPEPVRDEERSPRASRPSCGMLRRSALVVVGMGSLALLSHAVLSGARPERPRQAPSFRASISAAAAVDEEGGSLPGYARLGSGYCSVGFYSGLLPLDAPDLATCAEKCSSEARCNFFSFIQGQTCSRYDSTAGSCPLYANDIFAAAHQTYAKKAATDASSSEAPEGASASRNENQTRPVTRAAVATAKAAQASGTKEPAAVMSDAAEEKPSDAKNASDAGKVEPATDKAAPALAAKEEAQASANATPAATANATPAASANATAAAANATLAAPGTTEASTAAKKQASAVPKQARTAAKAVSTVTKTDAATDEGSTSTTGKEAVADAADAEDEAVANAADTRKGTAANVTEVVMTQTTTMPQTTTRAPAAYLRSPSSLYCWLLFRAGTYEEDLVRASFTKRQSVFGCDGYDVMSDYSVDLGEDVHMILIGNITSPKAYWGSVANGQSFVRAWDRLLSEERYWQYSWTVKVDPDTIFLPERLRQHVRKMPADQPLWVRNWDYKFGLLGPIEIFTALAIQIYADRKSECIDSMNVIDEGEDGYFGVCLGNILKVHFFQDLGVADFTGNLGHCWWGNGAPAMHPFKDPDTFEQCLDACIGAR